ncbi:MAG: 23S rRNA (uracil-5-)-methyltransferase RumA [Bacteroidetes bacterium GWE2_29_8]|nr:MAG: 23S rRNA (uracil-5-)-methyltransferase RumA [Bacteroidetes bacterium GWE2_29_8]OFY23065.1 MAG: 23S rRNA (uracil-5-)-methyltransferase RumA [Bacteroidetes bacterium GWF2_29_10]
MRKGKRVSHLINNIEVIDIISEGRSVLKKEDIVIFAENGVPGDFVDVEVFKKRSSYWEGRIICINKESAKRIKPFCEHFYQCGGCKWQFLKYEDQLFYKEKQVKDAFRKIGKIEAPDVIGIIGNKADKYYRNKLEFTFSNKGWLDKETFSTGIPFKEALGFHVRGMFNKIVDLKECYLQAEPSNSLRNAIKEYSLSKKYDFFDIEKQDGFLRNLLVRTTQTGETMLILSFFYEDISKINDLLNHVSTKFPELSSIVYFINDKKNDTLTGLNPVLFKGNPYITDTISGNKYRISPISFFQTNTLQAENLYNIVKSYLDGVGEEVVYDLYTGTGTIANHVANQVKKVVGIEYIEEAISDAKVNSEINNISNTVFYAGDMVKVLNDELIAKEGKPDVIITDPPRVGMHEDVVNKIIELLPKKVIYVSCNPATQARDVLLMKEFYNVDKIQPVDMFPHTHHVENVVLLNRK